MRFLQSVCQAPGQIPETSFWEIRRSFLKIAKEELRNKRFAEESPRLVIGHTVRSLQSPASDWSERGILSSDWLRPVPRVSGNEQLTPG